MSVWGWLYPMRKPLTSKELTDKEHEFTSGGEHKGFKVIKDNDDVYLEDLGGVYINRKKIDGGSKTSLNHNDCIGCKDPDVYDYVFLSKARSALVSSVLPKEISNKYLVSYLLGRGAFGEVNLVFDKITSKRYALKTIKKDPKNDTFKCAEANILQSVNHPCLVKTEAVVDSLDAQYIVLELMDGGDLNSYVTQNKRLSEASAKLIFYQLTMAVDYLHKHDIVHRDIKPENILLASRSPETLIKVTDFGVSKILRKSTIMDTHVGTPCYMAPEFFQSDTEEFTKKVDIWSMGVLLYFCLSGSLPFKNVLEIAMAKYNFTSTAWSSVSQPAMDLIKNMMQFESEDRAELSTILSHPWLEDPGMRKKASRLMLFEDELEFVGVVVLKRLPSQDKRLAYVMGVTDDKVWLVGTKDFDHDSGTQQFVNLSSK